MFIVQMVRAGLVLSTLTLAGCAQTHRVVPIASATNGDFVYYALPRTVITVTAIVSVSSVAATPPCARTQEMKDLGLSKPKIDKGTFFGVYEVKVGKHSEADPDARYAIDLEGTGAADLSAIFDVRGTLTKSSSESSDVIVPFVVGATDFVASIAVKVFTAGAPAAEAKGTFCAGAKAALEDTRRRLLDLYGGLGAANPKEIIELKAAKLTTLSQSQEFHFTGVKPGQPQIVTCDVRPVAAGDIPLFKWTKMGGLVPLPGVSCEVPDGLKIESEQATSSDDKEKSRLAEAHTLSLRVAPLGTDLSHITPITSTDCCKQDRSFYYRIPAFSGVEAGDVTALVAWKRMSDHFEWPIPQLGGVFSLPRLRSTKNAKSTVTLDAETGALLEAGAKTSEADFGAALAAVGKSTASVLQARKDAQGDEELQKLQREQAVLEARVAIKAAKAALGEQ